MLSHPHVTETAPIVRQMGANSKQVQRVEERIFAGTAIVTRPTTGGLETEFFI